MYEKMWKTICRRKAKKYIYYKNRVEFGEDIYVKIIEQTFFKSFRYFYKKAFFKLGLK